MTKVDGGAELAALFDQLPKSLTDAVVKAAGKKALQPVLDSAKTTVLHQSVKDYGLLNSLVISTALSKRQKRIARKGDVAVYAGPSYPRGAHGHLVEFGTGPRYHKSGKYVGIMPPEPFMRPAWDGNSGKVLGIMRDEIWSVLRKAVARMRKRTASGKLSKSQTKFFTGS
jgi:HK97 gp10 family phage protein